MPWWAAKGIEEKEVSWLSKSLFLNRRDQEDTSRMMKRQLEALSSFSKHFWNGSSLVWGWRDQPRLSAWGAYAAQALSMSVIEKKEGLLQGRAGQQSLMGELGFALGLRESLRSGWADKEEEWYWNERRGFGQCLWKTLIGTTFALVLGKQTVMQNKEEKGEHLGKGITNP